MRKFPLIPFPSDSGLRQPVHVSQLAAVTKHYAEQLSCPSIDSSHSQIVLFGGDTTLSYADMIASLQSSYSSVDSVRRCRLFFIPNRIFFLLVAPLLIVSPKAFEAVLRISANLSGFTPSNSASWYGSSTLSCFTLGMNHTYSPLSLTLLPY